MEKNFDGFQRLFSKFINETGPSVHWDKIERLPKDAVRPYGCQINAALCIHSWFPGSFFLATDLLLSSFVFLNCLNSQWLLFTFFLYNHSNKFYSKNCSNVHTYISTWYRGWHLKRQRWRGWRCYPLLIFFFFLSESPSYLLFRVVTEIIFIFRSRRTLTCLWRRTRPRSRRCSTSSLLSSSTEASEPPWVAGVFD